MKKIKVLHVTSCFQYGGTEAYIMNNFRAVDRSKYSFEFWIFKEDASPYREEINQLGGKIYHGKLPNIRKIFHFIRSLSVHIKSNGPYDVIHSHVNIMNGWVMLTAFYAGVKVRISHSHATSGRSSTRIVKRSYYKMLEFMIKIFATKKLSCSIDAGNYLYGEKYFSKHGEVVNNGIDVNKFSNTKPSKISKLIEKYNIYDNHIVIGNITRFDKNKNHDFIIDIFKEIQVIESNSILVLGGIDGGLLTSIKDKVKNNKLSDSVRFIGARDDVEDWLHIINGYLFPSLYEGLGIVLLEAQAAGVKCFASSSVSTEVDLGLGLIEFIDLDTSPKHWAKKIIANLANTRIPSKVIQSTFDRRGYSISSSIRRLQEIYRGE